MSTPPAVSTNTDPNILAIQQKCDRIRDELAKERRRLTRSSVLALIIGVIALVLLGGYFWYGYTQIDEVTQPKMIVDVGQKMLDEKLPQVRQAVEREIERSAPTWAGDLSQQALQQVPTARVKAEDYFVQRVDQTLKDAATTSDREYVKFLRQNRPVIEKLLKESAAGAKPAENTLAELQTALEKEMQVNLKAEAQTVLKNIEAMQANLDRLASGKRLTKEQEQERDFWMLVRRLQVEKMGENGARPSAQGGGSQSKPAPKKK